MLCRFNADHPQFLEATTILTQGGSIKDVADMLRHRSLNTSVIYAKLDQHSLVEVALPWPGSAV